MFPCIEIARTEQQHRSLPYYKRKLIRPSGPSTGPNSFKTRIVLVVALGDIKEPCRRAKLVSEPDFILLTHSQDEIFGGRECEE